MFYEEEPGFGYDTDPEPENTEQVFYDKHFEIFQAYAINHQNEPGIQRGIRIVRALGEDADTSLYSDIFIGTEPFQSLYTSFKLDYEREFDEPFEDLELMFMEPLEDALIEKFVKGISDIIESQE